MTKSLGFLLMVVVSVHNVQRCELKSIVPCPITTCKCSPRSKLVNCTGPDIHYIPVLPIYAKNVFFTKTNFPNITQDFVFNLTLIYVEKLHFVDTLTQVIDPDAFIKLSRLSTLELSGNHQLQPDVIFPVLQLTPRIQAIKLTSNKWKTVPKDMFSRLQNSSMRDISLSSNAIEFIDGTYFSGLRHLKSLDLSNNILSDFNSSGLESTAIFYLNLDSNRFRNVPSFCGSDGNPTCRLSTLYYRQNDLYNLDESSFQCLQFLRTLHLDQTTIRTLRNNSFVKLPKLEQISLLHIGDHLNAIEAFAFNSSSLKTLHFTNNRYRFEKTPWLYSKLFSSLPNLLMLDLTGNFLPSDSRSLRKLLTPMKKLQNLILQNTALKGLPRNVFQQMPGLRHLVLIGNYISGWNDDPEVFGNVSSLRSLYLDGNNIKLINKTSFSENFLKSLDKFCITNNPFSCTCDLKWFLDWMKSSKHTTIVNYPKRYTCRFPPEMNNVLLKDYNPTTEMCLNVNYPLIRNICIAVFVPSTFILIAISVIYKFRFRLNYWLHILGIKRVGYTRIQDDAVYEYDAFVIYSNDNRDFIFGDMVPELEEKGGCRLCIHERDFEVGQYIMDNITKKFKLSKNIILVLSRAFLTSEWCKFELTLTQSKTAQEGPGVLTVILLEELDTTRLPSSVRAILDTVTYTEWSVDKAGQNKVWAKVLTALNTHINHENDN
ncbi:toll-like receptor 13 [Argopecten irradians]|uniref:toll-like receptor 13 n=1 Tax=Argopecten irradians TaxID=31199 RepID=UPI0037190691